jgi:hypothetical protein
MRHNQLFNQMFGTPTLEEFLAAKLDRVLNLTMSLSRAEQEVVCQQEICQAAAAAALNLRHSLEGDAPKPLTDEVAASLASWQAIITIAIEGLETYLPCN